MSAPKGQDIAPGHRSHPAAMNGQDIGPNQTPAKINQVSQVREQVLGVADKVDGYGKGATEARNFAQMVGGEANALSGELAEASSLARGAKHLNGVAKTIVAVSEELSPYLETMAKHAKPVATVLTAAEVAYEIGVNHDGHAAATKGTQVAVGLATWAVVMEATTVAGAETGATLGLIIGGPPGMIIGGAIGGVVGGIGGYIAANHLVNRTKDAIGKLGDIVLGKPLDYVAKGVGHIEEEAKHAYHHQNKTEAQASLIGATVFRSVLVGVGLDKNLAANIGAKAGFVTAYVAEGVAHAASSAAHAVSDATSHAVHAASDAVSSAAHNVSSFVSGLFSHTEPAPAHKAPLTEKEISAQLGAQLKDLHNKGWIKGDDADHQMADLKAKLVAKGIKLDVLDANHDGIVTGGEITRALSQPNLAAKKDAGHGAVR